MSEQVVLVDKNDKKTGLMEKLAAHRAGGTRHRAISALLYRARSGKKEFLLQQRSKEKPLWPLYWTNTVCTHPRDKEAPVDCAVRRLKEEMGIAIKKDDLQFVYKLPYQAQYSKRLAENELDHLFVGEWNGNVVINSFEVADYRWTEVDLLMREVKENPNIFTPWFLKIMVDGRLTKLLDNI